MRLPHIYYKKPLLKAFEKFAVFKKWVTHLLAWPCNKPFSVPNANVLLLFGLILHWAHRLAFSVTHYMDRTLRWIFKSPRITLAMWQCHWQKKWLQKAKSQCVELNGISFKWACITWEAKGFSSVQSLSCVHLCDPIDCSTPGSPTPGVYSNSCPLSQWCHPTILSSVVPFSSCLQSFPVVGSFPAKGLVFSKYEF